MKIQTPPGCRDLLEEQLSRKKELESRLMNVFESFGFRQVSTPAIEYYQTYNQAFSSLQDREMYKFFDDQQDILALRMDMTVPIARMAATRNQKDLPLRFSYSEPVWKVRKKLAGFQSEMTDCGIELIGSDDNLEVLVMALQAMEATGVKDWTLELQDCRLFDQAAAMVFESEEDRARLKSLIDGKSIVELEEFLTPFELDDDIYVFFCSLPLLFGDVSVLDQAEELAFDEQLKEIIDSLKDTYSFLSALGYGDKITFDLGKLPHYNYYTGLIFEGFADGAGASVLSGGRYDSLMEKFGRPLPALGFSVKLDGLLDLMEEKPALYGWEVSYPASLALDAFRMADALRREHPVVLRRNDALAEIVQKEVEL